MDFDAQQQVQPQISGSERLMWAGRPKRGLLLRREDVFVIPFSILWCGIAISFAVGAHSSGAPSSFDVVALFLSRLGSTSSSAASFMMRYCDAAPTTVFRVKE